MANWYHWQQPTLTLQLHLQPRAKKNEIVGPYGDALKIRITTPPVDGRANADLVKFLAHQFGVSQRQVQLLTGESCRHKRVAITSPGKLPAPWFDGLKLL